MNQGMVRGSRRPLTEEQRRLAAQFLPQARALAWREKAAWKALWDEFESAACMALVEAAESFDPCRGVKFTTFARHRIRGALLDAKRQEVPLGYRSNPQGAPTIYRMPPHAEEIGRVITANPEVPLGHYMEAVEEVEWWLRKLPPRHALACRHIYLHDRTHREVARIMGCSQSRIAYLHREALAMLDGSWGAPATAPESVSA